MEDITDADYALAERVYKDFEIKKLDLYSWFVCCDKLLLADIFENFRNMCLEVYERDPAYETSLAWIRNFFKLQD